MAPAQGRIYGGMTPDEREQRRREQFLEAGLEVFADKGWAASTVVDICRAARLSQRYLYELYPTREALFVDVMGRIAGEVESSVREAAAAPGGDPQDRLRDVLSAITAYFRADPRTLKVVLVESMTTADFRAYRAALLASFSALGAQLMTSLGSRREPRDLGLSAAVISGGFAEALIAAVTADALVADDELVEHLARLYTAAATLGS
jgi:AcrR family transcriptional regulator